MAEGLGLAGELPGDVRQERVSAVSGHKPPPLPPAGGAGLYHLVVVVSVEDYGHHDHRRRGLHWLLVLITAGRTHELQRLSL